MAFHLVDGCVESGELHKYKFGCVSAQSFRPEKSGLDIVSRENRQFECLETRLASAPHACGAAPCLVFPNRGLPVPRERHELGVRASFIDGAGGREQSNQDSVSWELAHMKGSSPLRGVFLALLLTSLLTFALLPFAASDDEKQVAKQFDHELYDELMSLRFTSLDDLIAEYEYQQLEFAAVLPPGPDGYLQQQTGVYAFERAGFPEDIAWHYNSSANRNACRTCS